MSPTTHSADVELAELERDALTELVNIGVSRAASSLRKIVGEQVLLSIPAVEVLPQETAAQMIDQQGAERLVGIRQCFKGEVTGCALLILPDTKSIALVRAIVGEDLSAAEMAEMADDTLSETGNIILNGCLGSIANMLERSLAMSVPELRRGYGAALLDIRDTGTQESFVLFLHVNFSIRTRDLRGHIAIVMDLPSLAALKALLGDFIARALA
jgi:chemotaxis protein CheC